MDSSSTVHPWSLQMPVCSFYLRGVCGREGCPYLHVNVGRDADVCSDFLKGHCPHGTEVPAYCAHICAMLPCNFRFGLSKQCPKLHAYHCPEFSISGECPRGSQCPLKHQKMIQGGEGRGREASEAFRNVKIPKAFNCSKHRKKQRQVTEKDVGVTSEGDKDQTDEEEGEGGHDNVLSVRPLDLNEMPDFIPL